MNKLSLIRRNLSLFVVLAGSLLATPVTAQEKGPKRPVTLLVGFAPGSAPDTFARGVAQGLREVVGITVIVSNKTGVGGGLAAAELARATPDGTVLMLASDAPIVVLPHLQKLTYDPLTDFRPVAMMGTTPMMLVASPEAKFKTFNDFIAAAKAQPGALDYASWGIGSAHHVLMERLQRAASIKLNHIPYGTSSPIPDLIAGRFPVMWASVSSVLPLIVAGKLLPLATGSQARLSALPDLPTIAELGFPKFEAGVWNGVFAPSNMPPALVNELEQNLQKVALSQKFRKLVSEQSLEVKFMNSADFKAKISADYLRNKELFPAESKEKN